MRGDSDIQSIDDMAGRTLAYSSPGSSTNMVGLSLAETVKVKGEGEMTLVSTGGFSDTLTQILTKQVDAGFTALPFLHDKVMSGELRYAISCADASGFQGASVRVYVATDTFLTERRDVAVRALRVMQRAVDWAYANPEGAKEILAAALKMDMAVMPSLETEIPKSSLDLGNIGRLETSMKIAVENDFIEKPLS